MKTKDKNNSGRKLQHLDKFYFSETEENHEISENQQFVVPWQMIIKKEKKFLIK